MLLLARTTPVEEVKRRTDGLSVFLVDLRDSVGQGCEIRPIDAMINHNTTEVFFDNLKVPAENLIGEEGKGFRYILDGMNAERILIAAECIGDGHWFIDRVTQRLGVSWSGAFGSDDRGVVTPVDCFGYFYAVLHSLRYRIRYAQFLRMDFPRMPLTSNVKFFRQLASLGTALAATHLLESSKLDAELGVIGELPLAVSTIHYRDNVVWLDDGEKSGILGVGEKEWAFQIGGFHVCEKWLKDRGPKRGQAGRDLHPSDIAQYGRIVAAVRETHRITEEIEETIESSGGWPAAFAGLQTRPWHSRDSSEPVPPAAPISVEAG
jgi:hypothetical protein